jgi:hypothetical protein
MQNDSVVSPSNSFEVSESPKVYWNSPLLKGALLRFEDSLTTHLKDGGESLSIDFSVIRPVVLLNHDSIVISFKQVSAIFPFGSDLEEEDLEGFDAKKEQLIFDIQNAVYRSFNAKDKINLTSAEYLLNGFGTSIMSYPRLNFNTYDVVLAGGWANSKYTEHYEAQLEELGARCVLLEDLPVNLKNKISELIDKAHQAGNFRGVQEAYELETKHLYYLMNHITARRP